MWHFDGNWTATAAELDEDDDANDDDCLPVEVSVNDRLGEIVQVLHALGHINGDDELGLQVDDPARLNTV